MLPGLDPAIVITEKHSGLSPSHVSTQVGYGSHLIPSSAGGKKVTITQYCANNIDFGIIIHTCQNTLIE